MRPLEGEDDYGLKPDAVAPHIGRHRALASLHLRRRIVDLLMIDMAMHPVPEESRTMTSQNLDVSSADPLAGRDPCAIEVEARAATFNMGQEVFQFRFVEVVISERDIVDRQIERYRAGQVSPR